MSASGYYNLLQMPHTGKSANKETLERWVSGSYRSDGVHIVNISIVTVVNGTHFTVETCRLQTLLSNRGPVYEFQKA